MGALIVLIAACVVSEFFWWVVGLVAIVVAVRLVIKFCTAATDRQIAEAHRQREVVARADEQHRWTLEGDERGTYGLYPPVTLS